MTDNSTHMGDATKEKLRQYVARIERLEGEKSELGADIREVYSELKSFGFEPKIMRKVIALRKMEAAERAEQDTLTDMYLTVVESV